jgi:phenylacetate-coenzyme A ligase PaaK-like adenylate-forming protein
MFPGWREQSSLEELPYVPVGIFKRAALSSVAEDEIYRTLRSSGTTGSPSRIVLDRATASAQARSLTEIMSHVLGRARRPMLLVDTDAVISNPTEHTARAAGVLGMMGLGRKHVFLLDETMREQPGRLRDFAEQHEGDDLLIFGFTFMVWLHLFQAFSESRIDLSRASLIHSGGWKKLEHEKVGNTEFRARLRDVFGITHIINFYGMAEQTGSVFIEGEDGLLHPSREAAVIIRDPSSLEVLPAGQEGLIQVLSTLPGSYPGHSILTEDLGVIERQDASDDALRGTAFRVIGRLPKSELRGCSDTYAQGMAA